MDVASEKLTRIRLRLVGDLVREARDRILVVDVDNDQLQVRVGSDGYGLLEASRVTSGTFHRDHDGVHTCKRLRVRWYDENGLRDGVGNLLDEKSHRLGKIKSRSQFIFEHNPIKAKPE